MNKTAAIIFIILIINISLLSCHKQQSSKKMPRCIENEIEKISSEKVRNPPAQVWQWKVDGKIFFYINAKCCDQYSELYDDKCNLLCAPDGGFSGKGDGKCPVFSGTPDKVLIWEDKRK